MEIPFADWSWYYKEYSSEINSAISKVLSSGSYILGEEVEAFEYEWSEFTNSKYCVSVGNGFDAIVLALKALGIGDGDDVLVPGNTFVASWLAISAVGAKPICVEPLASTHNLDVSDLAKKLTCRTKAILVVHLYGQPADLDAVKRFAVDHGLRVIEDAAQAHGARYKNFQIGALSDITCWSFYPGKNLGAMGDSGAITCKSGSLASDIRDLRNYGSNRKYMNRLKGVNSRMDPIQAAVLRVKLKKLDLWNSVRKKTAQFYLDNLSGVGLSVTEVESWADPVWHLFVIQVEDRNKLQMHLSRAGIHTLIHYPLPPYRQEAYKDWDGDTSSLCDHLSSRILSLPIGPHLSIFEQEYIVEHVNYFFRSS